MKPKNQKLVALFTLTFSAAIGLYLLTNETPPVLLIFWIVNTIALTIYFVINWRIALTKSANSKIQNTENLTSLREFLDELEAKSNKSVY